MITIKLPIYKVVIRYYAGERQETSYSYFLDYFKALAYAEKNAKSFSMVAIHELEEDENGSLVSCKCIKVW